VKRPEPWPTQHENSTVNFLCKMADALARGEAARALDGLEGFIDGRGGVTFAAKRANQQRAYRAMLAELSGRIKPVSAKGSRKPRARRTRAKGGRHA